MYAKITFLSPKKYTLQDLFKLQDVLQFIDVPKNDKEHLLTLVKECLTQSKTPQGAFKNFNEIFIPHLQAITDEFGLRYMWDGQSLILPITHVKNTNKEQINPRCINHNRSPVL